MAETNAPAVGQAFEVDEHQVRRLLSAARRADHVEGDPVADDLRRLTGSANVGEALKKLVEMTFKDLGHMGSRLSELVVKSDLDGTLSFNEVASQMGLSLRQFFRYRARAVKMLAGQLRAIMNYQAEPTDTFGSLFDTLVDWNPEGALEVFSNASHLSADFEAIRALKAYVETARQIPAAIFEAAERQSPAIAFAVRSQQRCLFGDLAAAEEDLRKADAAMRHVTEPAARRAVQREITQARFLAARSSGTAHSLQRVVSLVAASNTDADLQDSVHNLEFLCYSGRFSNIESEVKRHMAVAQRQHDPVAAAHLCMLAAIAACYEGDLRHGRQLAAAARIAALHHVWLSAEAWILERRIALVSGITMGASDDFAELPEASWHRTMIDSVLARQFLAQQRLMEAKNLLAQCLAVARERNYPGVAAYNECTAAAVYGLEGHAEEERERYLRAWRWYVKAKDFSIALDLFTPPNARWREIGAFEFADLGLEQASFDDPASRQDAAVLIPIAERRGWVGK